MEKKVSILFYIILCHGIYAQSTFNVSIQKETTAFSFPVSSVAEDNEGNYYAMGIGYPDGFTAKTRLIKLNPYGVIIWDTTLSVTPNEEFNGEIVPAFDGGVLLAHQSLSYPVDDEDYFEDILLRKIDKNGNLVWQKVLPARNFRDIVITSDSCYVILGEVHEATPNFGMDLIMYKINLQGEILWVRRNGEVSKPWPEPWEWETGWSIQEYDESLYISGFHLSTDDFSTNNGLLIKYDLEGNLIWSIKLYAPNGEDYRINSVFRFEAHYYFAQGSASGIDQYYEFNPETSEYWEVDIFTELKNTDRGYNYVQRCNSEIISAIEILDTTSYFRKYDQLDTFYYQKKIPELNQFGAFEVIGTMDGGFLVLGSAWDLSLQVLKMDCLGNVEFWSSDCNSIVPVSENILIYPNPSQNEIYIEATFEFSEVYFYSVIGQYIRFENPCLCPRQIIDISNLAAGVYVVKIKSATNEAISKMVKL